MSVWFYLDIDVLWNLMLLSVCRNLQNMQMEHSAGKLDSIRVLMSECEKIYVTTLKLSAPVCSSETSGFLNLKLLRVTYDVLLCVFYKSVFHLQIRLYSQSTEGSHELVNSSPTVWCWRLENFFFFKLIQTSCVALTIMINSLVSQ